MRCVSGYVRSKKSRAFRDAFEKRARKTTQKIKVPAFALLEPDDYYTYYVMILGISEDLFFHADFSFVRAVADSKGAYDAWLSGEREHLAEKLRR